MSIARRGFLGLVGATAVGAAVLSVPLIWRSETELVIGMLRKRLPDLRMDATDLQSFAEAFLVEYKRKGARRREAILVGARMVETLPDGLAAAALPGAVKSPLRRLERELFHAFFLGTDFLEVHQDPAKQVSFLFIPDPYEVGCSNQLAQFDA